MKFLHLQHEVINCEGLVMFFSIPAPSIEALPPKKKNLQHSLSVLTHSCGSTNGQGCFFCPTVSCHLYDDYWLVVVYSVLFI